jgi:hypothetical protein
MNTITALALFLSMTLSLDARAAQGDAIHLDKDFGTAVSDKDLGTQRGGQDQFLNDMKLYAQLYNNKAMSNVTGENFVTQEAFAGTKGFATVIQNSGNNVIIQNATILNLRMQ